MCLLNFVLGNSVACVKQTPALCEDVPASPMAPSSRLSRSLGLSTKPPMGAGCRHGLETGGSRQYGLPLPAAGGWGYARDR